MADNIFPVAPFQVPLGDAPYGRSPNVSYVGGSQQGQGVPYTTPPSSQVSPSGSSAKDLKVQKNQQGASTTQSTATPIVASQPRPTGPVVAQPNLKEQTALMSLQAEQRNAADPNIQTRVKEMQAQAEKSGSGGVTDSTPVDAAKSMVGDDLKAAAAQNEADRLKTPSLTAPDLSEADQINQSRELLAMRNADLVRNIQADYAKQKQGQAQQNKDIIGGTRAFLGRSGSFEAFSGQSTLMQEQVQAEQRMQNLLAEEQAAISQAQAAYETEDFARLSKFMDERRKIRGEINAVAQQGFENTISAEQEFRASQAAEADRFSQSIDYLAQLPADQFEQYANSPQIKEYEKALSLPDGYFKGFAQAKKAAEVAKDAASKQKSDMAILDYALKIPVGMKVKVGDSTIEGLDAGGVKVLSETDNAGNLSIVTVNPATGKADNVAQFAGVGKSAISGKGTPSFNTEEYQVMIQSVVAMGGDARLAGQALMTKPEFVNAAPNKQAAMIDFMSDYSAAGDGASVVQGTMADKTPFAIVMNQLKQPVGNPILINKETVKDGGINWLGGAE